MADEYEPSQEELDSEWAHAAVGLSRNAAAYDNLKRIHAASVAAAKAERERIAQWHEDAEHAHRISGQEYASRCIYATGQKEFALADLHQYCAIAIRALPVEETDDGECFLLGGSA